MPALRLRAPVDALVAQVREEFLDGRRPPGPDSRSTCSPSRATGVVLPPFSCFSTGSTTDATLLHAMPKVSVEERRSGQFRMERDAGDVSLSDADRRLPTARGHLDAETDAVDPRGADEGDRGGAVRGVEVDLGRVDLRAERVATDVDVEQSERLLAGGGVEDGLGEQDESGAGAQRGDAGRDRGAQGLEEVEKMRSSRSMVDDSPPGRTSASTRGPSGPTRSFGVLT